MSLQMRLTSVQHELMSEKAEADVTADSHAATAARLDETPIGLGETTEAARLSSLCLYFGSRQ
jgi:hypothetical protein